MTTTSALIVQADALRLPLPDESVDLIVSSPPYFALRSYRDGDEHYAGQLGSEPTPQAFLEALWAVMHECWRVLKPSGSCFINLGDKRSGSGGHNNSNLGSTSGLSPHAKAQKAAAGERIDRATRRNAPDRYNQAAFGRPKSKMLLPHRFAIGCEDGLADPEGKGWVVRSDIVWQKLNGLPESVTDRCRDSHEYLFHLTKSERYFAAVDEVREPHAAHTLYCAEVEDRLGYERTRNNPDRVDKGQPKSNPNPLGKLPGSVWALPSEPLVVSDEVKAHYDLPDHFAAFPTELVRRVILGWSPSGICVECGEGRRPVVAGGRTGDGSKPQKASERVSSFDWAAWKESEPKSIAGYACRCGHGPHCLPPTRPAVVLDIFGGTGTTAGVARALGRTGISVDLSHDYCRLADYLIHRSGRFAKVVNRTNREAQGTML